MAKSDGRIEIEVDLNTKKAKKGLKGVSDDAAKIGDELKDSGKKGEKSLDDVAKSGKKSGTSIKKGMLIGVGAIAGIGAAAVGALGALSSIVEAGRELSGDMARLDTNARQAGVGIEQAREEVIKLTAITGEADSSVEALSNVMAAGFNGEQLTEVMENITGATIKFSDTLKSEGIADSLQETLASGAAIGQFGELLERSSVDIDEFNAGLQAAQEVGEGTNYILEQLAKLGLTDTLDSYKENNKELVEYEEAMARSEQATANLSTALMPLQTKVENTKTAFKNAVIGLMDFEGGLSGMIKTIQQKAPEIANKLIKGLLDALQAYKNNYPRMLQAGQEIVSNVVQGIVDMLPEVLNIAIEIILTIVDSIINSLPDILDMGIAILDSLIDGILEMIPQLPGIIMKIITTLAEAIFKNLPIILEKGMEIVSKLIVGIVKAIPELIAASYTLIFQLAKYIVENMPQILEAGWKIVWAIIKGIGQVIGDLWTAADDIVGKIWDRIMAVDWAYIGRQIVMGIVRGITEKVEMVKSAAGALATAFKSKTERDFDIHSPSRWMKDHIIGNIAKGGLVGAEKYKPQLEKSASLMSKAVRSVMGNTLLPTANKNYNNTNSGNVTNRKDFNVTNHINGGTTEEAMEIIMKRMKFQLGG